MTLPATLTLSSIPYHTPHVLELGSWQSALNGALFTSVPHLKRVALALEPASFPRFVLYLAYLKHALRQKKSPPFTGHFFEALREQDWIDFFTFLHSFQNEHALLLRVKDAPFFASSLLAPLYGFAKSETVTLHFAGEVTLADFPKERMNKCALLPVASGILCVLTHESAQLKKQIKSASIFSRFSAPLEKQLSSLTIKDILNSVDLTSQIEQIPKQFSLTGETSGFFIHRSVIYTIAFSPTHLFADLEGALRAVNEFPDIIDEILIHPKLLLSNLQLEQPRLNYDIDFASGEIAVSANVSFGERQFPPAKLKRALAEKIEFVQLSKSQLMPLGSEIKKSINDYLLQCDHFAGTETGFRLPQSQFGFVKRLARHNPNVTYTERYANFLTKIEGLQTKAAPDLSAFCGELRPYQKRGVAWLNFLKAAGFGGILADEMGLGKTVQIIAFLSQFKNEKILILCPNALVSNWERECARFAPEHSFTIKPYGQSAAHLSAEFDVVILDEAQAIKNSKTKLAQTIYGLQSRMAIALTGTPIENSYEDLWSIFEFILPKFLGDKARFNKRYKKQILTYEEQGDSLAAEELRADLRSRISPFILRRLKSDKSIISDLPEKFEQTLYCEASSDQKRLYKELIYEFETHVPSMARQKRLFTEKPILLTLMLRLKQLCNHPAFLDKDTERIEGRSGKFELLKTLAMQLFSRQEKVLIFSQFSETCELIHHFLNDALGIPALLLTGKTEDRDAIVDTFQRGALPYQLILTLKTGGVGLNLTAATAVIHFDRWWNPAVENQASDRAFRIGQTRDVSVYKFVTSNTIEDHIEQLLTKKETLFNTVISSDEAFVDRLSSDDISDLIKPTF